MPDKAKTIVTEYEEIWELASKLAGEDEIDLRLSGKKPYEERRSERILEMLEMYQVRYGNPEERLLIVDFIERHMKNYVVNPDTLLWKDVRKAVLSGAYREVQE